MKLKNKLLPFIGTAAIVATAAPLALTSCKSNNSIQLIDVTDGTKATPTIEPMKALLPMGQTEYTKAYIKACKENPEIFKQDFIYGQFYQHVVHKFSSSLKINYLKVGCTTPTFGVANISYPGEPDVQYATISFSYRIEYSSTDSSSISPTSYQVVDKVKVVEATVKDAPLLIRGYSYKNQQHLWVDLANIGEDPYIWKFNLNPWTIQYSYNIDKTTTTLSLTGKTVQKDNESDARTINTFKQLYDAKESQWQMAFGFNSYHLSKVQLAPEFIPHKMHAGTTTSPIEATTTLATGLAEIPHEMMKGLYIPKNDPDTTTIPNDILSVSVFAGYGEDGKTKLPIALKQVLPEGSTDTPVYIVIPTDAYAYNHDGTGWNARDTVEYDDADYEAYQYPQSNFYNADLTTKTNLKVLEKTGSQTKEEKDIYVATFELPKSIMVQFSYKDGETTVAWDQQVWLSQEEMSLYATFEEA